MANTAESPPLIVNVWFAVRVFPSAIVNVLPVAGVVIVTLFIVVADAAPSVGVTNVIEVHVPVGVYDPPSSRIVSAASRTVFVLLVLDRPVKVNNPDCPDIDKLAALPVVFWFSVGNVQFVSVPEAGVPNAGVVSVGEVRVLLVSVCVAPSVTTVSDDPGNVIVVESVPASVMELFIVNVFPSTIVSVDPVAGVVIVSLFIDVADATPSVGVVNDGDVVMATLPDPLIVYSPSTPALSYRTLVLEPEVIVDVPTVNPAAPDELMVCVE